MADPAYPGPEGPGFQWMTCDSTTAQYPADDIGGATTVEASSTVANATLCVIKRFILLAHNAGSNLMLLTGAGATIDTFAIPDATEVGKNTELDIERRGAFGFKLSGGTAQYQIMYRVHRR